jgi:S1-C subfamily serine protease
MEGLFVKRMLLCLALTLLSSVAFAAEPPAAPALEPPAAAARKPACTVCGDECKCKPGDCPGKCPLKAVNPSEASVFVSIDLGGGRSANGTGTVIASEGGKTLVLTNAHVVPSAAHPITVTYWSENKVWTQEATYVGGSSVDDLGNHMIRVNGPDLALLSLNATLKPVEMADAIPAPGDAVYLYGFGGAGSQVLPHLKVGRAMGDTGHRTTTGDPIANTTIASTQGDSGSGIFNDRGQLVAVLWGGDEATRISSAVRLDTIHAFTVAKLRGPGLFPRLQASLAARKITKALAKAASEAEKLNPFAEGCPNGKCPKAPTAAPAASGHWENRCGVDSRGRKMCTRVWIPD